MVKIFAVVVFLLSLAAPVTFADDMLNLRSYSSLFINNRGWLDTRYYRATSDVDFERIAPLGGDAEDIDTPLEIALLSNSVGVIDIRPIEASRMLGTPRQADLKLGAAVFQEIQILRFLGNTAAVGRHEGALRFITDRGNVTRAEVEAFYRNGIRGLVSDIVDEEAAKRPPTNPTFVAEIKQIMTSFFLNPTRENHNVLHQREKLYASTDGQRGINAASVLVMATVAFNLELGVSVLEPVRFGVTSR